MCMEIKIGVFTGTVEHRSCASHAQIDCDAVTWLGCSSLIDSSSLF